MSVLSTRQQARYRRASVNSMILGSLFVGCLAILFATIDQSSQSTRMAATREATSRQRIDLSQNWEYAPDVTHRSPDGLPSAPTEGWRSFDPNVSWKFSDEIRGPAWFRTSFEAQYGYQSPALVLGQIPGPHEVYLNGHLIGGSDQGEALAFYPFDWNDIQPNGTNTLLVSTHSRPTLQPGITPVGRLGMFIGNIQDVRQNSMAAQTRLYVTQGILLSLSVSFFFVTLGFAIFRKAYRQYFYAALVLLLSSLHLAELNPWIAGKLDLSHLRLLQAIALTLSPFTLYSACLHLQRRYLAESINNGAALLTLAGVSVAILKSSASPAELTQTYHYLLIGSMVYALSWISITSAEALIPQRAQARQRESQSTLFEAVFIFFGVAAAISCFTNGDGSRWAHSWSENWAKALPFAFSFFIVAAASLERNINRKAALIRASRDELVTGLIRFIHDSPNVSETVIALQARVAMFLKARRSTLYLIDSNESGQAVFKATYIHGDEKTRGNVSRIVRPDAGIIGYVCENRTPLLIEDIRKDPRFAALIANPNEQRTEEGFYQTGSCMIIPLIYGNALLGVLTFADKKDGSVFTQDDFAIAVEVSTDLAVLLDSRQLQESLKA